MSDSDGEGSLRASATSDDDVMANRPDVFKKPMFMDQQQSMDFHTVPISDSTDDMEEPMGNESMVRGRPALFLLLTVHAC
jgi:hypothetical protein